MVSDTLRKLTILNLMKLEMFFLLQAQTDAFSNGSFLKYF